MNVDCLNNRLTFEPSSGVYYQRKKAFKETLSKKRPSLFYLQGCFTKPEHSRSLFLALFFFRTRLPPRSNYFNSPSRDEQPVCPSQESLSPKGAKPIEIKITTNDNIHVGASFLQHKNIDEYQ